LSVRSARQNPISATPRLHRQVLRKRAAPGLGFVRQPSAGGRVQGVRHRWLDRQAFAGREAPGPEFVRQPSAAERACSRPGPARFRAGPAGRFDVRIERQGGRVRRSPGRVGRGRTGRGMGLTPFRPATGPEPAPTGRSCTGTWGFLRGPERGT
jgi:hypothetical protein